jgi:flagellar export protein FliJ
MSRKAADLDSLIRLHNWTVDERRRELGVLLQRQEELILLGQELDRQLMHEKSIAASDPTSAGFLYGAFAANHRLRRDQLKKVLADLRRQIDEARENLADAYRQLKVYEEVQKKRGEEERKEEARQEQVVLDEIGLNQHLRRKSP